MLIVVNVHYDTDQENTMSLDRPTHERARCENHVDQGRQREGAPSERLGVMRASYGRPTVEVGARTP
ncbi:MAG: hypothetical protein QOF53_2162 [Nocardioidaceae bacterium]|nr:hypothetical protein [Nocardioidaceae bacterium]